MTSDPVFNAEDADITLCSLDGTPYRIHSLILRLTSGFFRVMLSLPQGTPSNDQISLAEPAKVLGVLLRMISGLEIPRWTSVDDIEAVLEAASKYDMAGPISMLRPLLSSPICLDEPFKMFAIAARFEWREEMIISARQSLILSIHDVQHEAVLERVPSRALIKLINLHHNRRGKFRSLIEDKSGLFSRGNSDQLWCTCGFIAGRSKSWLNLRAKIAFEMDRRPMGDTVALGVGIEEWPEATACWNVQCGQCNKATFDRRATVNNIRQCLEDLPQIIDL